MRKGLTSLNAALIDWAICRSGRSLQPFAGLSLEECPSLIIAIVGWDDIPSRQDRPFAQIRTSEAFIEAHSYPGLRQIVHNASLVDVEHTSLTRSA